MARLKAGDAAAFEAIYEAYRPRLFSFLARLSRRRDVAEDLLEETWLRLAARAATLDDGGPVGPWLFTVARNLYVSEPAPLSVARPLAHERGRSRLALSRPGDSPFEAAARSEIRGRRIEIGPRAPAVKRPRAPDAGRREGLTPSEVAGICGLSAVAVRARLHRARERLATEMGPGPHCRGRKRGDEHDDVGTRGRGPESLSALRVHDASPERAERIRARCVAELPARKARPATLRSLVLGWREWLGSLGLRPGSRRSLPGRGAGPLARGLSLSFGRGT